MDIEHITQEGQTEISLANMETYGITQASTILSQKLNQVSTDEPECSIYRVHGHLRDLNPKAYEPEVIAIGPYHRDKGNLKMMEDHKLRYLRLLLHRGKHNFKKYVSVIGAMESKARDCYANPVNLDSTEFIEMLVLDGCFIVELVRKNRYDYLRHKNDPIFRMDWITNSLQRDLMLFENQLPFFVLCELFDLIEVPNQHGRLMHLLSTFFKILSPGKVPEGNEDMSSNKIKHLLDLMHCHWLPPAFHKWDFSKNKIKEKRLQFINHASGLREANVKFERNEAVTVFDIKFRNGTIFMAPLTIEDRTESILRNLIAYEQYFQDSPVNYITDYVKFLDCLIDSPKDVEILTGKGIVDNWLGDDKVVAKIVNSLLDSVAGPGSRFLYAQIFENVGQHCGKPWNWWMAKLRRNYLNSPWTIISIVAAVFLLLLTVTQTLFTILQVV